ncbi:hypothetical protein [Shewanella seohaensis]|uniref:hypothetical protein n=1 Tax=Shewanella seohaensis TaxID=755175 RepID=UPI0035B7F69F
MPRGDPQEIWEEYYRNKKFQRLEEAHKLCEQLQEAGVTEETVLALDFVHFSKSHENAQSLAEQLSENYTIDVVASEDGVWYINGTSRPYGLTLSAEQHIGWVEFMADVAQSHACVFSTWSFEAPSLNLKLSSESIESAS